MNPNESARSARRGAAIRGIFITLCMSGYAWVFHQPTASWKSAFLVGGGLQLLVIVLRRVVPPEHQSQVMNVFELLVDGATVLMFALGVFGGILHGPADL
jgi:Na+-transporting NADH:ubiquinone oxidoreductase subunit NqrB